MELTRTQKNIHERRLYVEQAYNNRAEGTIVSALVKIIAKKFKVTEPTIWGDLKELGYTRKKQTN